jgi:DNA primase
VATRLLGAPPGRRASHDGRLWYRCFLGTHEDANPSLLVDPDKGTWHRFGCGAGGDAAELVKLCTGWDFPAIVAYLTGAGIAPATPP